MLSFDWLGLGSGILGSLVIECLWGFFLQDGTNQLGFLGSSFYD